MDAQEIGAFATQAQTETAPDGLGSVQPSIPAQMDPQNPLLEIPMSEEEAKKWWERIDTSDARIKKESEAWQALLKMYLPVVQGKGVAEDVNTNAHFRNVHTKLGQMFVEVPEVRLEPAPNGPGDNQKVMQTPMGPVPIQMSDVIAIKQEITNTRLGRDGIKVNRLFDLLNFDVLAWAGIGCSKLGYKAVTKKIQQPVMGPDPNFIPPPQMGNVLGLALAPQPPQVPQVDPMTGEPVMQEVEVTIYDEIFWRHFSPMKLVTDASLYSTMFDEDATMLGMRFAMMPPQAAASFGLDEGELRGGEDEFRYKHMNDVEKPNVITGVEIFYKACFYLPGEVHPWKLVQLVFLDHMKDAPVVHRFYKDQDFTETGELSETSIDRFPIRVLTIRDLPDSQFPPSDAAFTNNLVKQLNTNRQQGVALRDMAIGRILFDSGKLEDGDESKVKNSKPGDWIAVEAGGLDKGVASVASPLVQPTRTNDDYRLDAMLQQNMDETLGISANSSGASEDTVRSATEIQTIQRAVQGRNKKEQGRVIDHFLDGVRLIDILIMRYTTQQQWAKVTGQDGAQRMMMWNGELVSGRYLYSIAPDTQLMVDTAQDRQQNLNFYNLTAQDPLVNRAPILMRLARQFGYDPAKIIINPMQMQPPHGGPVNKHEEGKSGGGENTPGAENHREGTNGGPG
jgi:hypothetical protein